jgi:hypothetical protein
LFLLTAKNARENPSDQFAAPTPGVFARLLRFGIANGSLDWQENTPKQLQIAVINTQPHSAAAASDVARCPSFRVGQGCYDEPQREHG